MNLKLLTGVIVSTAFLLPGSASGQTADFNIVPQPLQADVTNDAPFILNGKTSIVIATSNNDLKRNATLLASYIEQTTGVRPSVGKQGKNTTAIVLSIDKTISNAEGYKLDVDAKRISIAGASAAGVFYGIQTLRKSLPVVSGKASQVTIPCAHIVDAPRFSYRGTHLDVSRHFVSTDEIRQFIDILALHNINRFHWHLTDDQGWRIEIKKYPLLTEVGSKRTQTVIGHNTGKYDGKPYGGFYTQKEIRDIVKYAADRYITIVPEIDLPGHMQAALAAYPELGCTGGPYKVWEMWGVSDNVLCAGNDKTMKFVDDVLKEVVALFPSKSYMLVATSVRRHSGRSVRSAKHASRHCILRLRTDTQPRSVCRATSSLTLPTTSSRSAATPSVGTRFLRADSLRVPPLCRGAEKPAALRLLNSITTW